MIYVYVIVYCDMYIYIYINVFMYIYICINIGCILYTTYMYITKHFMGLCAGIYWGIYIYHSIQSVCFVELSKEGNLHLTDDGVEWHSWLQTKPYLLGLESYLSGEELTSHICVTKPTGNHIYIYICIYYSYIYIYA